MIKEQEIKDMRTAQLIYIVQDMHRLFWIADEDQEILDNINQELVKRGL